VSVCTLQGYEVDFEKGCWFDRIAWSKMALEISTGDFSSEVTRVGDDAQHREAGGRRNIERIDPEDFANLPYRILSNEARLEEYTEETVEGQMLREVKSNKTGKIERYELVTWKIQDPENPKNFSKLKKWYITLVVAATCFVVAFNSAVVTADIRGPAEEFGVSEEVSLLSITLFVIGFGIGRCRCMTLELVDHMLIVRRASGPMVFAPLSEILGRRPIYAITLLVAVVFIIPEALSGNIATLLVCRAIDGIAFSAPMTLVGGTLADLWRNEERGVPMAAFSAAPFIGPAIGG
jgi:hypothetical protein